MNFNLLSASQGVYSLAAIAAVGLGWSISRRAARGIQTNLLLAALGALVLQYGALAIAPLDQPAFTFSTAAADVFCALYWGFVCHFLVSLVDLPEERESLPIPAWGMTAFGYAVPFILVCAFGRAAWHSVYGAPFGVVQSNLANVSHVWNSFISVWIIGVGIPLRQLQLRVPKGDRTGWAAWTMPTDDGRIQTLGIEEQRNHQAFLQNPISRTEFNSLSGVYYTALLLILIGFLRDVGSSHPAATTAIVVCRVLLLPALMGMIYYQPRFTFLDVALKRGLLFVVLSLIAAVLCYPFGATLWVFAVVFGAAWVWLYDSSDRMLDRVLFHRPDYQELLREISASMSRCTDAESLIELVSKRLSRALGVETVEFADSVDKRASLIIRIGPPERTRGYLLLGLRARRQSYRSEDLNFLDAVAAQFFGLLESFEARQARDLATRSELKALRAQINPHFLFNALNTLADMAKDRPEAEQTVLHLSKVFRYVLDSTRRETVPLREEIAFIRSYLEIEQARFEDKLRFDIDVPDALLDEPVPPMLLQPLVENAIKHGITPKIGGGAIHISALRGDHGLRFTVSDDGVGFDPVRAKMNVGIANVRARVEALGGGWSLQSAPERGTSISFELAIP